MSKHAKRGLLGTLRRLVLRCIERVKFPAAGVCFDCGRTFAGPFARVKLRFHSCTQNAGVEPRRGSDVGSDPLLDALSDPANRNVKVLFWSCPNGCRDRVVWDHDQKPPVATCQKCDASNKEVRV